MKNYIKYFAISLLMFLMAGCDLDEEPVSYAGEKLFDNETGAQTVLNGVYSSMLGFNYYGADYHHLLNMASGLFSSDRTASYSNIASLNPLPSLNFVTNVWKAMYQTISRCNDLIYNMENIQFADKNVHSDILGQAYFIRSLTYFHLVRTYGGVPLITTPVTVDNIHSPRESTDDVYAQIILDAEIAADLLPETGSPGRPAKWAANMLLAKVYIQLAGNKTSAETGDWQLAWDEAIKVYTKYTLVNDFSEFWYPATGRNTVESIFELQSNEEVTLRLYQLFTPKNGTIGWNSWSRFRANLEVYDKHASTYPTDPRIGYTFHTKYVYYKKKTLADTVHQHTYPYPVELSKYDERNKKPGRYPYLMKYYNKDHTSMTYAQTQSFIVFRYAELLLMLAEIENELNGPAAAYTYVNEVLARARNSAGTPSAEPADWSGLSQEQFREAIMYEYQFELLCEGDDFFRVRRRGYDEWFKPHVIDVHNSHPVYGDFSGKTDAEYPDNSRIILMPISSIEITSNNKILASDQNPGY